MLYLSECSDMTPDLARGAWRRTVEQVGEPLPNVRFSAYCLLVWGDWHGHQRGERGLRRLR
jgi:hypothetical protein